MTYHLVELHSDYSTAKRLEPLGEENEVIEYHQHKIAEGLMRTSFLVAAPKLQHITDSVQARIGPDPEFHITVSSIDTVIPKPATPEDTGGENGKNGGPKFMGVSREVLLDQISSGVALDNNFLFLVLCSTIVAAIGLLEDSVAVVIGAMVIAPLLGPNLALAFGTALGEGALIKQSIKTNLAGISLCLLLSVIIGLVWPKALTSHELLSRTTVNGEVIVLAIVSGAAAVLSLTRGISSVMVGVMVAVALLPPATTMGIMAGAGQIDRAAGALMLLGFNIICVNLAAIVTLRIRGVRPRTWYKRKAATRVVRWYAAFWVLALIAMLMVYFNEPLGLSG